jgi:hypothetical protein
MQKEWLSEEILIIVLKEIESEIRYDGICPSEKALLFHQLGTVHGLMGDYSQQKIAWEEAKKLDPKNHIIILSLEGLK